MASPRDAPLGHTVLSLPVRLAKAFPHAGHPCVAHRPTGAQWHMDPYAAGGQSGTSPARRTLVGVREGVAGRARTVIG